MIDMIAFDADDTLWENETLYSRTQDRFQELLSSYMEPEQVRRKLYETEMVHLPLLGYGIKAFVLSMITTAIEISNGEIKGSEIQRILDFGFEMLQHNVELLDQVEHVLEKLAKNHPLMLVTKGDLLDQEGKLARSGIAHYFQSVEIVSDKTAESYAVILKRSGLQPERFLMVGNSMRSDILPVLELGGKAVYIPHALTWEHEHAPIESERPGLYQLDHISQLPALVEQIHQGGEVPDR
jgi:putative hydrolase of the HAD superfamily